jgi:ACS family pantothenate transporter-like MFS transporter
VGRGENCTYIRLKSVKMAYPYEKAVKNAFITEASELPVVLKSEVPENDAPAYTPFKRTWKSYF